MQQLLANDSKEPIDIRDRAMIELFYSSGLRLSELQGLNLNSINLRVREVRVMGKGNKERIVPLGRYASHAIQQWLKVRLLFNPKMRRCLSVSWGIACPRARFKCVWNAGAFDKG